MYEVLCGNASLEQARRTISKRSFGRPSNLDLAAAELELAGEVGREMILRDRMQEDDEPFDYLVLDCPPSLGVLTVNALVAVNEVFLPLQPHFLALHGLSKLLRTIEVVSRRLNSGLRLSGVMLCMYDSNTRLAAEVCTDIDEFFQASKGGRDFFRQAKFFDTRIRRNIRLAEAPSFGQSILQYAPGSNGALDYQSLAEEVMAQEKTAARARAAASESSGAGIFRYFVSRWMSCIHQVVGSKRRRVLNYLLLEPGAPDARPTADPNIAVEPASDASTNSHPIIASNLGGR